VYGLDGETLTADYPKDHPHHRGISWSWPVTRWKDEVRDIWAVIGVWSRPASLPEAATGPVLARLEAENVWKWGDKTPIVREQVLLRVFRRSRWGRFVDVEIRLTALQDGVAIGGRPHAGYGGFGLRAAPVAGQVITLHTDEPAAQPRRSWLVRARKCTCQSPWPGVPWPTWPPAMTCVRPLTGSIRSEGGDTNDQLSPPSFVL